MVKSLTQSIYGAEEGTEAKHGSICLNLSTQEVEAGRNLDREQSGSVISGTRKAEAIGSRVPHKLRKSRETIYQNQKHTSESLTVVAQGIKCLSRFNPQYHKNNK
jgi:hypothetical protein